MENHQTLAVCCSPGVGRQSPEFWLSDLVFRLDDDDARVLDQLQFHLLLSRSDPVVEHPRLVLELHPWKMIS